ncbi:MAG: hydroxylamine reductase [Bacillota bacterium]
MFCNQCEQTAKGEGCTVRGVCGKSHEVATLQDILGQVLKSLALYAHEGRRVGLVDGKVNRFTAEALFSTLTNVNFDQDRFVEYINEAAGLRDDLKKRVKEAGGNVDFSAPAADLQPAEGLEAMIKQGEELGQPWSKDVPEDIASLQRTMYFGIKGISAYAHHAAVLGREDDAIYAFLHEGLAALSNPGLSMDDWLGLVLKCGEINLKTMELLDAANTGVFGSPVPTEVPLGHKAGKCILVSGHDLHDLKMILEQTEGKGIFVYTHGEMLPAHGYPELKKHKHLYGNYGSAWQNQQKEFPHFPGPIVMTTNCIREPKEQYFASIYTREVVGWPGAAHIEGDDYSAVIEKALAMPGFTEDEDKGSVTVGFAHDAVMGVADKVIAAVKSGAVKHIYLVAGCDGAKPGRNYYTEFVEKTPPDTLVLTLACGKYRFYDQQLGDIGGIPRLLDMGQCNDAYSAIKVAAALSEAFELDINDLPLSLIISWYEQKAVAILLTLLYLGLKDIRLGPSLPAFITPNVLNVLVEKFNIMPIGNPEEDLVATLK